MGELVGGLLYDNHAGGSGLMAAAVFGWITGEETKRAVPGYRMGWI